MCPVLLLKAQVLPVTIADIFSANCTTASDVCFKQNGAHQPTIALRYSSQCTLVFPHFTCMFTNSLVKSFENDGM